MRAGKLDRVITIERATTTIDASGTPQEAWATLATMRAELLDGTTDEFARSFGASTEAVAVFRTRYLDGLTVSVSVTFEGRAFGIKQVKEIGRRRGLELRTERIGP
jgi:SPP1 family predicted phage head-tail adaptor